jgi:hypothetical protein
MAYPPWTQVYTRVSITKMKAVHTATQPAALLEGRRVGEEHPEKGG